MIKRTLLYGHPTDSEAFETYYANTHLPIAAKMTGVDRLELTRFGPGAEAATTRGPWWRCEATLRP